MAVARADVALVGDELLERLDVERLADVTTLADPNG